MDSSSTMDHSSPTAAAHDHDHATSYTHMTFFWGTRSEILFSGWPGASNGMYLLALVFVFVLSVVVEWLGRCRLTAASGLVQAAVHAARVGLGYVLMLAVMSFNVGVLTVAVVGHAVGFLAFGRRGESSDDVDPIAC